MQAVILAAGMGKRLKELTSKNTKCMVKVNGVSLIERLLRILDRKQLSRIVMVVGYCSEQLKEYVDTLGITTQILFIDNEKYDRTNNIYSLSLAQDYLVAEDTLLFESDLIFEERVVDRLIEDKRENLAVVAKYESWMDGTCLDIDSTDRIIDFIPGRVINFLDKEKYFKTVNIYKFSSKFSKDIYVPCLDAYRRAKGENEYYESAIKLVALMGSDELKAMRLKDEVWYEIDDIQDLDIAESLFASDSESKYRMITGRYGGYWRYPQLLDFCYLVNPYFPPARMMEEIESNLNVLIRTYPSGSVVNSLLGSRNFGVNQKHIIVGNGAAELIKTLLEAIDTGRVGVIRPTFEEYPNRISSENLEVMIPVSSGYRYSEKDIISYFDEHPINTLVLINPDNPSGNYITNEGIMRLIEWAGEKGIILIIDESFVDFADRNPVSLLDEQILRKYDRLFVVKSISKSYGVPGIRLGVLACSDEALIDKVRRILPIWNINSPGEFFMQIFTKYEQEYRESLAQMCESRKRLKDELDRIGYLRCFDSAANYLMCEVTGRDSAKVCEYLLNRNILIKDLTSKINDGKQYIRIAVKTSEENKKLLDALRSLDNKGYRDNSKWHEIWNNRIVDTGIPEKNDEFTVYKALKKMDGFDVDINDDSGYYARFYSTICSLYEQRIKGAESVFEVGCGSGADLYVLKKRGLTVAGIDYSETLCNMALSVLEDSVIIHDEAINLDVDAKYDIVLSDSVFAYFPNEEYGANVLKKMMAKATKSVILLEIFDKEQEEECLKFRRSQVENYDEVYEGLDKIFYSKDMFVQIAQENGWTVEFTDVVNEHYWNSRFMYNVILNAK